MKHCNIFSSHLLSAFAAVLLCTGALAQPLISSQWEGSRVAFLGDSITDARQIGSTNNIFWNNLKDILGIEPYVYGISGHRMNQIVGQAEKLEAEHGQAVDAIIVFVGTNDFNGSIPLGEWYTYSREKLSMTGRQRWRNSTANLSTPTPLSGAGPMSPCATSRRTTPTSR